MSASRFVDCAQVARRFARAAADYAKGDFLVREIDRRMQERLDVVTLRPTRIADLGCSRGGSLAGLTARYPEAQWIGLDLVPAMLRGITEPQPGWRRWLGLRSAPLCIAAEATQLPLAAASVDLVWSNLLLHWLDDPLPALAEAQRVLAVGGLLMFSTLGPDTLGELRAALADGYAHTQRFIDMHDLGDMLLACGFADPVMDMEVITLTYDRLDALFADLRAAGSTCAMTTRRRGLGGRQTWQAAEAAYEAMRRNGKLPASFEVVYGHAWKAAPKQQANEDRAIIRWTRQGGR
ncbi:MAG: methyltransferase domain-containing protein [Azonexus sp.]|jgi:malonyl-CoA O-methyltransferase|nr:methyltransferase domain-containing protein [Azonexus sp.]